MLKAVMMQRDEVTSVHGSAFMPSSLNMLLILQVVLYSRAKKDGILEVAETWI